jgi:hypothetical protein
MTPQYMPRLHTMSYKGTRGTRGTTLRNSHSSTSTRVAAEQTQESMENDVHDFVREKVRRAELSLIAHPISTSSFGVVHFLCGALALERRSSTPLQEVVTSTIEYMDGLTFNILTYVRPFKLGVVRVGGMGRRGWSVGCQEIEVWPCPWHTLAACWLQPPSWFGCYLLRVTLCNKLKHYFYCY